jgi:hypothetical protein
MFSANECSINTKFVLTLYQQDLQPGLLMDIRSLVDDDCYLYQEETTNYIMAGYEQISQFLILPVDEH